MLNDSCKFIFKKLSVLHLKKMAFDAFDVVMILFVHLF